MDKVRKGGDESYAQSVAMLLAVIEGRTYDAVAADFGFTRSTVERRVKGIAERLARQQGVVGVEQQTFTSAKRLRTYGEAVTQALQRFDPNLSEAEGVTKVLTENEVVRAAHRVRIRGICGRRDVSMFYMLFATGARPLEIARLEVADYLEPGGQVRRESILRTEVTVARRSRPLFFASSKLIDALDDYLSERVAKRWGIGPNPAFRGLDPSSRLFLANTGKPFEILPYGEGGQRRFLCRQIFETYRKIFRNSELRGATPLSVRRTMAARLYERRADDEQVGLLLGINDRRALRGLFAPAKPSIEELVDELI